VPNGSIGVDWAMERDKQSPHGRTAHVCKDEADKDEMHGPTK
jgi:hypothetical protein